MPNKFEIVNRRAARAAGLKRYFTGKPCAHDHTAERQVSGGGCLECSKLRARRYLKVPGVKVLRAKYMRARVARMSPEQRAEEMVRVSNLSRLRNTGFTPDMFQNAIDAQGGRCGVCGVLFDEKYKPQADHEHSTGITRGLLCNRCNSAEGFIHKTGLTPTEWGKRLQQYLDSHSLV
jgi:hypothetical protein